LENRIEFDNLDVGTLWNLLDVMIESRNIDMAYNILRKIKEKSKEQIYEEN